MPRPSKSQTIEATPETEQSTPIAQTSVQPQEIKAPELTDAERMQEIRFLGNGVAYCKTCIRALQTDVDNTPICPINKVGCDRNKR